MGKIVKIKLTKQEVNYHRATVPVIHRCGNCIFNIGSMAQRCTKVDGRITADYVCDKWESNTQ